MSDATFRTILKTSAQQEQINHTSTIVLFGSCFSENIGNKLSYFKFENSTNPYGVLFNPVAIENAISDCIKQKEYTQNDLFFFNERFHSFKHHSDFSNTSSETVLEKINATIANTHNHLQKATHLIITLGTSWVYKKNTDGEIVANCHKVPQKEFSKELLSMEEIKTSLKKIQKEIVDFNPKIQIIFTVSPVRHLKDGFIENSLSKAHLLAAIHQTINTKNTFYFPAYEIVNDDLRDYRFYEKDMLHPNEIAVNYIWEAFQQEWVQKESSALFKDIDSIQKGKSHKAFAPNSEAHKKFLKNLAHKIEKLEKEHGILL